MRTMHMFAGAGGGLLADRILGHTPTVAIEWDAHACAVLRDRTADGWFPELEVVAADVRTVDFSRWAGRLDCIAAGFPCQDISSAGSGAGIDGERSGLVWQVFRAIDAVRPAFVWLENSPRIRTKGRDRIIAALVARGYAWRDGVLGAADVGASHQRDRWWCLAADADGLRQLQPPGVIPDKWRRDCNGVAQVADAFGIGPSIALAGDGFGAARWWATASGHDQGPPDRLRNRLEIAVQRRGLSETDAAAIEAAARHTGAYDWSPPDAGVCRMVDGMASRMDRIECAGNGQVPLAAAAAWIALGGPVT